MSDDDERKVGYGRPPKHTQFKPGQSGNPKGRPKGSRNFKTDVMETLRATIQVRENGRPRKLSTQQAALFRLREKALNGDSRSLHRLLELAARYNGEALVMEAESGLPEEDQEILDYYNARQREPNVTTGNEDATIPGTDQSDMPGRNVDE